MRNRASLALIELAVMLLVFGLAAAVCLQAFTKADEISRQNEARDKAVILAQSAAELLQSCRGDLGLAASALGGSVEDGIWQISYDRGFAETDEDAAYLLRVTRLESAQPLLCEAEIEVITADGKCIISLSTAWQEE